MTTNKINGRTRLVGLLGTPIKQTKSPHMHNSAFQYLDLDYAYLAFEVGNEALKQALDGLKVLNAAGCNVTMPNKQTVLPLLDELSQEAKLIGSVNTVLNDSGKLIGYNTDGRGFVKNLEENGVKVKGKKFLVAGAGGAGRAVAIQLAIDGAAEIFLIDVNDDLAKEVCGTINNNIETCKATPAKVGEFDLKEKLKAVDVLVNCTPLGMYPNEDKSIVDSADMLYPELIVADIVYSPLKTKLLSMAEEAGCKTVTGIGMMIWQGALAFKIWTGVDMPVDYIKDIILGSK